MKIASFPLTLTLSPGESEQPLNRLVKSEDVEAVFSSRFTKKQGTFLPLPEGAGRGEGKANANSCNSFHRIIPPNRFDL
jgi:hypothetical protein